ncbi:MAG TPA: helix-turn-helix transcriptional regulator [Rubrobacteraceae bacterium]|nr:helix-turn-helix transcriptional regulator [Rubrobacteraceae bacterium]
MATDAASEDRAINEVKRLCNAGLDQRTLLGRVVECLRPTIPFEAICVSAMDPSSRLITHSVAEGLGGLREMRLFFEHIYLEGDAYDLDGKSRGRDQPVMLLSEVTGGQLERSLRYREQTGPLGLGYEMSGACMAGGELWGGIALLKERGSPDYEARDVRLLRRIVPHLGAGLRMSALLPQAPLHDVDGDEAPGILVLDHRGHVVQRTRAARRYLEELGDVGPGRQEGDGLPIAVWMVVSALRRALEPRTDRDLTIVPCLSVKARTGRWLTLQGALTEARPGSPGQKMIVIEPAGPRQIAWLKTAAYGLSPREREIVDLVLRGASRKQIAATLYISEYTVQDHLSNIFDKVGVRGREALIKRLFLDNLYPALMPPDLWKVPVS